MIDSNPTTEHSYKTKDYEVACLSWCTAKHEIFPLLFKFAGDDEVVYTVRDVFVKAVKNSAYGYPFNEYLCEAVIGGLSREFLLMYWPRDSRWVFRIKLPD